MEYIIIDRLTSIYSSGTYEISEADDDTPIGTTIRLHLKSGDAAEFAKQSKVTGKSIRWQQLIKVYCLIYRSCQQIFILCYCTDTCQRYTHQFIECNLDIGQEGYQR
jgi:hypothetical protein